MTSWQPGFGSVSHRKRRISDSRPSSHWEGPRQAPRRKPASSLPPPNCVHGVPCRGHHGAGALPTCLEGVRRQTASYTEACGCPRRSCSLPAGGRTPSLLERVTTTRPPPERNYTISWRSLLQVLTTKGPSRAAPLWPHAPRRNRPSRESRRPRIAGPRSARLPRHGGPLAAPRSSRSSCTTGTTRE